jgi:hypothetical protein
MKELLIIATIVVVGTVVAIIIDRAGQTIETPVDIGVSF